jgi:molybdate transport system permease protein
MDVNWFPLWLSLRVASIATLIAAPIGLWLANLLAHGEFRGKQWLEAAVGLPLILPPTILGYFLLVLFNRAGLLGTLYEWAFGRPLVFTWQAAVLASTLAAIPWVARGARGAFDRVASVHGRAARNLGASEWSVFWRIALPLAWRGIAAACMLAFARAIGEFGITLMLAGRVPGQTQTAAVAIYSAMESGDSLHAGLLVLALSVVVAGVCYAAQRLDSRTVSG